MPAAVPGEYRCADNQDEHSPTTVGANGPTGTLGTRSGYDRADGDLFVTDLTSKTLDVWKRHHDYGTMPTLRHSAAPMTSTNPGTST